MNNTAVEIKQLYESEYDQWLEKMVILLKNRELNQLDYDNLIEELEALGRSEKSAVKSLFLQIIVHLMCCNFWESQREWTQNHWQAEITTFRIQLEDKLTTNLKNYLRDELKNIYKNALLIVSKKTNLQNLPKNCPYTFEQIIDKNWFPNSN